MHCDTLSEIRKRRKQRKDARESLRKNHLSVDIQRLKAAGAAAQFFACYVNAAEYGVSDDGSKERALSARESAGGWDAAYEAVLEMIRQAHDETGRDFLFAKASGDIPSDNEKDSVERTVAGVLTVEEGGVLNGQLSRLDALYERDVRLVTLTWNYPNCIGYPNSRDRAVMESGLTDFGIRTVERMNRLGMIIDVSHLSDGGFWDCIRHSRLPVAASHSNARSLCPHPRNLSDEMLHALGENGGVAGLNFYSDFLTDRTVTVKGQKSLCVRTGAEHIAAHAAWMMCKAGEDAVALGTDFDGFDQDSLPEGIRGAEDMELVWKAFREKGITPRQIDKIAYGNVKRVIEDVWR